MPAHFVVCVSHQIITCAAGYKYIWMSELCIAFISALMSQGVRPHEGNICLNWNNGKKGQEKKNLK